MKKKIRNSVVSKTKVDRTPCEVHSINLTRVSPIDPSEIYGLQKWEWLKELVAAVAVSSLNAFKYLINTDPDCVSKIDRAVAGMVRDTGGLFKARARLVAHIDPLTDLVEVEVEWANLKAKDTWAKNRRSMREAQKRFRERRPELIQHATARNRIRQRIILGKGH